MRKAMVRSGLAYTAALVFALAGLGATARPQGQQKAPGYSYAEYNAYEAAAKETNPEQRIKALDDFVAKFPKSTLLPYVYQAYYQTYDEQKQYDKVIENADKLVASDSAYATTGVKLQALYAREGAFGQTFNSAAQKAPDAARQAKTAEDNAALGLKLLDQMQKPANATDAQWAAAKKQYTELFVGTQGFAALFLKDYPTAEKAFASVLANEPNDSATYLRLGVAYLDQAAQEAAAAPATSTTPTPPPAATSGDAAPSTSSTPAPLPGPMPGQQDYMKGFWALARAVALKGPNQAEVQSYLQNQMLVYQKTACPDLLTTEMNQLLQMAQSTATVDPPASYAIPSGPQLGQYLTNSNLFQIMQDLQAGGDRANFVWLAVCGNEFPNVPVKVISVSPTADGVDMQVYSGATPKDIQGATTANMEAKVENQPDAQRLQKDNIVRFTGTLVSYDPAPNFLLHWDKAQVNPADITPAKPGARRMARRGRQR